MNLLSGLGQTAFEWTWKTSFYASLLIVLVFGLQMILAKWLTPRLRYTLSLLVLIRLLLPITPSSVFSFENLFPSAARLAHPIAILPISNQSTKDVADVQKSHVSSRLMPAAAQPIRISVSRTLGIVWASGSLGLLSLAGWRLGKWNGLIRKGRPISDPRLLDLLNNARQAMQIRSPVELVAIAQMSSPAVFGLFRLRLLLPETVLRQMNGEELRMIFLHEMAHVRRKDIPLNYLLMAVQFLHWFNPLVWLALHRLRADRELVCDAMVMQKVKPEERLGYGKVLIKLMDGFSAGSPVFSGAVPVISSMEETKRRILMIKNHRTASFTVCATTAPLILALAFGSFTHARGHFAKETKIAIANLKEGLQNEDQQARRNAMANFWTSPITVTEAENPTLTEALPILLQATTDQDRAIRSDAVFALRKIRSSDQQVMKALGHLVRVETDLNTAAVAATALKETGPSAAPAVPDLIQVLESRNDDGTFISATEGPVEPNLALGTALRRAVIEALGNIGAPAQDAVPILRGKLNDTGRFSLGNRVFSAEALWQITGKTDEALPVLISALEKDNSFWAADILGMMGAAAKPAIPTLRSALQSTNSYTRLRSAIALDNITSAF
jgi:beta-lactamase regulating signal transducer with metallopeptidase domain/HEAT repeat protein